MSMLRFTRDEMLGYWLGRLGLSGAGAVRPSAERSGLEQALQKAIDHWYARLLETASLSDLPSEEVASECKVISRGPRAVEVRLPERAVRPVAVRMADWKRAETLFTAPGSPLDRLQDSLLMRATAASPVVVRSGPLLRVYGSEEGVLASLTAICDRADTYVLSASLLESSDLKFF